MKELTITATFSGEQLRGDVDPQGALARRKRRMHGALSDAALANARLTDEEGDDGGLTHTATLFVLSPEEAAALRGLCRLLKPWEGAIPEDPAPVVNAAYDLCAAVAREEAG